MTTNPILDLTTEPVKSIVYVKDNIQGWVFDAVLQKTHTSTLDITSYPVQAGSTISDFAYLQPRTLSMNIGMTDVATSIVPGQFGGGPSRSVTAWQLLEQIQQLRIPVQVYTRLGVYQNMLVRTLSAQDDYTTKHALRATVDMQELLVAEVTVVKISANPSKTDKSKRGKQQPQQVPSSLASAIATAFGIKVG